jgi:hypothetical protein
MARSKGKGSLGASVLGAAAGHLIGRETTGRGMIGAGIGFVATRIATRSIPGAIVVGGGLLAKSLYDRKKARDEEKRALAAVPARPARTANDAPAEPDFGQPIPGQRQPDPIPTHD